MRKFDVCAVNVHTGAPVDFFLARGFFSLKFVAISMVDGTWPHKPFLQAIATTFIFMVFRRATQKR